MKVISMQVGAIGTNCYLVKDETSGFGFVVDPGDEAERILSAVQTQKMDVRYIFLTHAHFDHVLAAAALQRATGAYLVVHTLDAPKLRTEAMTEFRSFLRGGYDEPRADILVNGGECFDVGSMKAEYLYTPGHTNGSCCIRVGDCLFSGDTLFRLECGRCDLPTGDFSQMLASLAALAAIGEDLRVYPGHDRASTLAYERAHNPYIRQALAR